MKYLKINIEENADTERLKALFQQIKGVNSVEIIDADNPESELKKAFNKSKEQFKKGEYEHIVNDIFDILISSKSK